MRQMLLAICSWVLVGGVIAQSTPDSSTTLVVEYPYNPDSNGDASIGTPDLLDFLPGFNSSFQPQSIMVDSITLEAWLLMLQARLDDLEANGGSGFGRDDVARWVFGKELAGTDFGGLDLRNSAFPYADLQGANFANAQLQGSDLRWADMTGANFYGANFGPNNDCSRPYDGTYFMPNSAIFNSESVFDGANLACLRGCGCLPPGWVCTIDAECSELRYKWMRPDVDGFLLFSDSTYDGLSARGEVFLPGPEGTDSVSGSSFIGASISGSDLSLCPFVNCDFTDARIDTSFTAGITNSVMVGFESAQWKGGDLDGCNLNGAQLNFSEEADGGQYNALRIWNCTADNLVLDGEITIDLRLGNQIDKLEISSGIHPQIYGWPEGPLSEIDSLIIRGVDGSSSEELYQTWLEQGNPYLEPIWVEEAGLKYADVSNSLVSLSGGTVFSNGIPEGTDSLVIIADSSVLNFYSMNIKSANLNDCKLFGAWSVEVAEAISFAGCDASAASFSRIERVSVCPDFMPEGWVCEAVDEECGGNGPFVIRPYADSLQTLEWFGSDGDVINGCDVFLNANYSYDSTLFDSINVILPEQYALVGGDYVGSWEFNASQFEHVTLQGSCWNPVMGGCDNGVQMYLSFYECDFAFSDLQLTERSHVSFDGGQLVNSNIELLNEYESTLDFHVDSVVNSEVKVKDLDLYLGVAENLTVEAEDWVGLYSGHFEGLTISASTLELADLGPLSLDGCSISASEITGYEDDMGVVTEVLQGITPEAWEEGLQFQLVYGGGSFSVVLESVSSCPSGLQFPFVCSDDSGQVIVSVEF